MLPVAPICCRKLRPFRNPGGGGAGYGFVRKLDHIKKKKMKEERFRCDLAMILQGNILHHQH